jgi:hypothetical protein
MKESFDFSLMDFLAYLFPGTMMILVIAAVIRISPFKYLLYQIPLSFVVGVIMIACAYCVGVSISSAMASVEGLFLKYFRLSDPTARVELEGFESDVIDAFAKVFGDRGSWSTNHFLLARTLVCEKMPRCAAVIERQASLRQLRRNIVIPVLCLGIVGTITGVKVFLTSPNHRYWGAFLIPVSLFSCYLIARGLIKNGMHSNRRREMREVCFGLLTYNHGAMAPLPEKTSI